MSAATSDYLNQPLMPAERRAFAMAIRALREIAEEGTTMGPEATAEAVLDLIRTLAPEMARDSR